MPHLKFFAPKFVFTALLLCILHSVSAQRTLETAPKIIKGTMTKTLRSEIETNKDMIDALAILKDAGDYINIGVGKVRRIALDSHSVEVTFSILTKVANRKTEYKSLVYCRGKDKKAAVYFDEENIVPQNNPTVQIQGIFGCGPWSAWQVTGTSCDWVFACFSKGQAKTFELKERTRQCNNGIRKQTKKTPVVCGC